MVRISTDGRTCQKKKEPHPTLSVFLYDIWGQEKRYTAKLDSQSSDDWISDRVVSILRLPAEPTNHSAEGAEGTVVSSEDEFHIFRHSNLDMIFGWSTCQKYKLLSSSTSHLLPILAHSSETEG
ncbi:hypothetical protein V8E51_009112 [Hyaloscypha variabilis]